MSFQHGKAGRSTRQMEAKRGLRRLGIIVVIIVGGYIFFAILPVLGNIGGVAGAILVLGALAVLKVVMAELGTAGRKVKKEERRAERGAKAEEQMGTLFDALSDDYWVLNDVSSGRGNIDHLLVSKTKGIFVIETKSHRGRITADGDGLLLNGHPTEKNFINQTLGNCLWLKERMKQTLQTDVWVTGVIVFTNAFVQVQQPIRGVHVINKGFFERWLERQKDNPRARQLWERRDELGALVTDSPHPS